MTAPVMPTPSSAVLPRWVKDVIATVPKTRGYVVSTTGGEFVLKVQPAAPRHRLLQPHQQQQAAAQHPQRAQREENEPQVRATNARQLRSADRARKHAAKRHRSRLRLQELMHKHLWRSRGWQRMQDVWTEWSRRMAPPTPPPALPPLRPLQIVDPALAPALPPALAPEAPSAGIELQDNRGSKREADGTPPQAPQITQQPPKPGRRKKPKKLAAALDAAAEPPSAAAPPTAPNDIQPNTAYPIILDALVARRCAYRSESEAVQEGLDGVHLLQPHSQSDRDARLAELLQLIPPFDRRGRQRDKGLVHMIVEGEKPLPPDLISMIVARAGVPQEPPH